MAKTIIAYPISDISVEHDKYPTNTTNAYTLINDEVSDDDTSYIRQALSQNTTSVSSTSTFGCSANTGKVYITGISTLIRAKANNNGAQITSSITPSISINNGTYKAGSAHNITTSSGTSGGYNNYTQNITGISGLNTIYNSIADANIRLRMAQSSSISNTSKSTTYYTGITQANITVTYLDVFETFAEAIPGSGVTTATCSAAEVVDGNTCTFTATLGSGVDFDGWYSDFECTNLVSTSQTYVATITSNTTLYARGKISYNINVYADSNCTVTTTKQTAYIEDSVTITATPNSSRYEFVGWYSNPERTTLITTSNPYTFNVTGNATFYAKTVIKEIMYVKLNNVWVQCSKVYKKVDGAWVEQETFEGLFDTTKNYKIIQV